MRLNKFIAEATGKSRREADDLIASAKVTINDKTAILGAQVEPRDKITLNNQTLHLPDHHTLLMLNKPIGYVSSRRAQAKNARTLYDLLPKEFHNLKTVGRLDQNSSGLILLTDDGDFAFRMTHPKFTKTKVYQVKLDQPLQPLHQQMIADFGIDLPDGKSKLGLNRIDDQGTDWQVTMHEGRNRQIRRTFAALGYEVIQLHRLSFGNFTLDDLKPGGWQELKNVL